MLSNIISSACKFGFDASCFVPRSTGELECEALPDHKLYVCHNATIRAHHTGEFILCPIDGAEVGVVEVIGVGDYPQYGIEYAVYQITDIEWKKTFAETFPAAAGVHELGRLRSHDIALFAYMLIHTPPTTVRSQERWMSSRLQLLKDNEALFVGRSMNSRSLDRRFP